MSSMPLLRIASRFCPRTMNVTSSPASASFAPTRPPMAPAPMIAIFMSISGGEYFADACASSTPLLVAIAELADAVDEHFNGAARLHRAHADRFAAKGYVAGIRRP